MVPPPRNSVSCAELLERGLLLLELAGDMALGVHPEGEDP
jgi:hypothetical protein